MGNQKSKSYTVLPTFQGKGQHKWIIKNWRSWLHCDSNPNGGRLVSDVFTILMDTETESEPNLPTRWQIIASPVKNDGEPYFALALKCLEPSHLVPNGSFYFSTSSTKFPEVALDSATSHTEPINPALHQEKNLTIKVKIKIAFFERERQE